MIEPGRCPGNTRPVKSRKKSRLSGKFCKMPISQSADRSTMRHAVKCLVSRSRFATRELHMVAHKDAAAINRFC